MHRLDFNLLVTLNALLAEGSVQAAAERMNITAPAMSHALARLRVALGDPLLVRAGQRLVPTPRAIALREQVRIFVEEGDAIFRGHPKHEVDGSNRTFNIRANGNVISVLAPALLKRVEARFSGARIRFVPEADEGISALREGTVDLAIGVKADIGPEVRMERLFDDAFVGVVRVGNPLASGKMTLSRFAAADHVVGSRRGRAHGPVDSVLESAGLSRRVSIVVPDMLSAIAVAASSDHVAAVPSFIAKWAQLTMKVAVVTLPLDTERVTVYQYWHPRFELDSAHSWLRQCISECAEEMVM